MDFSRMVHDPCGNVCKKKRKEFRRKRNKGTHLQLVKAVPLLLIKDKIV